ncbi:MAG: 4-hydroxy-3-methylbut-2-enyl diphosphate reductase [Bacteroidales bacterium]|nr:4-hydroxy-3-methylbut-2-enyl diphosphate reductase [Bacteroidales bacterium]
MMNVKIDNNAGFCFGVVKAIAAAEEELEHHNSLYCLGDIVHNSAEVDRLRKKGLQVIDYKDLESLRDTRVLIRAHGEPPSTYATAKSQNIELVDATCPMVLALQKKIKQGYEEMRQCGGQVVIFGKVGHAEVVGLNGQTEGNAIIVSSLSDIDKIDMTRPIRLYSQTTKNREEYEQLISEIKKRCQSDVMTYNTLCSRVANRAKELEEFAQSVDVVLFVSGSNSSNGKYLYEYCKKVQPKTFFVTDDCKIDKAWLEGAETVGITGATSTPRWLMEDLGRCI